VSRDTTATTATTTAATAAAVARRPAAAGLTFTGSYIRDARGYCVPVSVMLEHERRNAELCRGLTRADGSPFTFTTAADREP
jgi:hypothetical protein